MSQDHEFSEDDEPEDVHEEIKEHLEGKKKATGDNRSVPADDHSETDNSVKKVLTAIEKV